MARRSVGTLMRARVVTKTSLATVSMAAALMAAAAGPAPGLHLGGAAAAAEISPSHAGRRHAERASTGDGRLQRDEIDMLVRARAEWAAQRVDADIGDPSSDVAPHGDDPAQHRFGPTPVDRGIDRARAADRIDSDPEVRRRAIEAEVAKRIMEAEREAELDRLSEKIGRARRRSVDRPRPAVAARLRSDLRPDASYHRELKPSPLARPATRVTILLVMEPGRRGIRRFSRTADPILCVGATCYISRGAERNARAMPRRRAFGTINTLGGRAGACRNTPRCVFRNVDLGVPEALVQPIDLRYLRHDRRALVRVKADPTCRGHSGRLNCEVSTHGPDYRLWVVPERMARSVGARGLQRALETGLRRGYRTALPVP